MLIFNSLFTALERNMSIMHRVVVESASDVEEVVFSGTVDCCLNSRKIGFPHM